MVLALSAAVVETTPGQTGEGIDCADDMPGQAVIKNDAVHLAFRIGSHGDDNMTVSADCRAGRAPQFTGNTFPCGDASLVAMTIADYTVRPMTLAATRPSADVANNPCL